MMQTTLLNVLGQPLMACCTDPITGFMRDGFCRLDARDPGQHTVCAVMTASFLTFTQSCGNDLSTPIPAFNFPGLKPGDRWCLCLSRWQAALPHQIAPPVVLDACHQSVLEHVPMAILLAHAYHPQQPPE